MDMRVQQEQYEIDTDTIAAAERLRELHAQFSAGVVELPRTQAFIARAYGDVKASLDAALAPGSMSSGKYFTWMRKLPTELSAVIALRECIATLSAASSTAKPVLIQTLASGIGRLYDTEIRVRDSEAVNPLFMQKVHKQVQDNNTTSKSHLRRLYSTAHSKITAGEFDSVMTNTELLQFGRFGVQACMDAGVVQMTSTYGAKGLMHVYSLTPDVFEYLSDYNDSDVRNVFNKSAGAMMCKPDPWTNLNDGGYLSTRRKFNLPLMSLLRTRKSSRAKNRELFTAENMPLVFECANYLQDTEFKLHNPTLAAIMRVWESGGGVMGVPAKNPPVSPVCPLPEDWAKDKSTPEELAVFTEWKFARLQHFTALRSWRSKVRELAGFIKVTKDKLDSLWLPVFFDTRGRWYYRGTPNPQGSDLSKGVLHSGIKKPLGERGVYWLKVAIANSFGFDKARFDDRALWTDQHWGSIRAALSEPENHPDVWGTDSPWCMFSAATELNAALLSGNPEAFESGILVHMDATCSGLQHFSAMLRDPTGGLYVNLTDPVGTGPKQDIYARVAANCTQNAAMDSASTDKKLAALAAWWYSKGIPRNMAKNPVMTYCYGATMRGTMDFVAEYLNSEMKEVLPPDAKITDYTGYAAKKLFDGIASAVPAAAMVMQWLRSVAGQMPCGKRMEWTTPTGFLVQQDYQGYTEVRVKLRSCGSTSVLMREPSEDTIPTKMRNAIAPNFVHALDASHLTLTALGMKRRGLTMVGIHDSFGTHASDVDALHEVVRHEFVQMYTKHNVLANFMWDVGALGAVPMLGTLDLQDVIESEFFFC
jgi:DNA-directed RNA polymerase